MKTNKKSTTAKAVSMSKNAVAKRNARAAKKHGSNAATSAPVKVVSAPATQSVKASAPKAPAKNPKLKALPENVARKGSMVDSIYQVLRDTLPHPRTEIFAAIPNSASNYQIITDLRKLGAKLDTFEIELIDAQARVYQLHPLGK